MLDRIFNTESSTFRTLLSAAALAALCGMAYGGCNYVAQPSAPATNLKIRLFEFERTVPTAPPPSAVAMTPPAPVPTTPAVVDPCLPMIIGGGCTPQPITTATFTPPQPAPVSTPAPQGPMTNTVTVIVGAPANATNVAPPVTIGTSPNPAPKPTFTPPTPAPGPKPVATSDHDGAICVPSDSKTAQR